jgi:hypothetical protein
VELAVMPAIGSRLRRARRQAPAGIQYAVPPKLNGSGAEYWIIRFRG